MSRKLLQQAFDALTAYQPKHRTALQCRAIADLHAALSQLEPSKMYSKLTYDDIESCFPDELSIVDETGSVIVRGQWMYDFAHAIEDKILYRSDLDVEPREPIGWAVLDETGVIYIHRHREKAEEWLNRGVPGRRVEPVYLES